MVFGRLDAEPCWAASLNHSDISKITLYKSILTLDRWHVTFDWLKPYFLCFSVSSTVPLSILSWVDDKKEMIYCSMLCVLILLGTFTVWIWLSKAVFSLSPGHSDHHTPQCPCWEATALTAKSLWQALVYSETAYWVMISADTALNFTVAVLHCLNPSPSVWYWSVKWPVLYPHHICLPARSLL